MYLKRMDFGVNDVSSVFSSFCSSGVLVVTLFAEWLTQDVGNFIFDGLEKNNKEK